MGKILPILLILIGVGGGVGAGLLLKPAPSEPVLAKNPCGDIQVQTTTQHTEPEPAEKAEPTEEYVKLNNQFVVPVVKTDKVESLVVLSLSVAVANGRREEVYKREPKLRDAFLQVLFDHANMGGFRGAFTNSNNMDVLRRALRETSSKVAGDLILDVLIVDINRQDV